FVSGCSHRFFMRIPGCNSCHARSLTEIMRDRRLSCVVVMVSLLTKYSYQRIRPIRTLNQTTKDWHSRSVTLSEAKGLAVRFFAALRMTLLNGCVAKCTNVVHFDLDIVHQGMHASALALCRPATDLRQGDLIERRGHGFSDL